MRLLPERRRHLRILTLKNAAWIGGTLAILFIAFTVWNEVRSRGALHERLSERTVALPAAERAPAEVIEEQPVSDETFATRHNARQLEAPPPPAAVPAPTAERARPLTLKEARERGERVVVTGGAEGVSVESTRAAAKTERAVPPPNPL